MDFPGNHANFSLYLILLFFTLQRSHDVILRHLNIADDEGFTLGAKVVRGAYMDEVGL